MAYQPDLTLEEARTYIDRALEKARELKQAAAFVVVDAGGNVVSISRVGEGATSSVWVSRAKAYVSAVQRSPSARSATNWRDSPALFTSFQHLMHDEICPGPGGMPIRKDGRVVGDISTGGGLGPWTEIPGIDPSQLTSEGQPANAEDLIISYALQIPYQNQHEEGRHLPGPRTEERTDDLPHCLTTARRYADRAIEEATRQGMRISVAVVDEAGQLMQMDRMDGATPMSPDLAEAKAQTALNFGRPTIDVQKTISADRLGEIRGIIHYRLLAGGGGVPVVRDGAVVGALGVHGGGGGEASDEIARAAVA